MTTKEPITEPTFTDKLNKTDKPDFTKDYTTTDVTFTEGSEPKGPTGKPFMTKDFTSTQPTFTNEMTTAIKIGKST